MGTFRNLSAMLLPLTCFGTGDGDDAGATLGGSLAGLPSFMQQL
jgi:hypothetical protein